MVAINFLESLRWKRSSNEYFVDKLIRLYRANECLWNPKSPGYRNLSLKENAWQRISHFFSDELTVDQLKLTIMSLRHFYERERLREHFNAPRETYYQKLQFLENAELENDNVKATEAQTKLCNSQINCVVEDTFLKGNSQNSIHSEHVDFGLPFPLSDDYSCKLALSEKKSSLNLPHPPIEFQAKGLQIRALSGNDRSYSKSNYNGDEEYEEYDKFRHRPSRSHSMQPKPQRPNSNNNVVINQNDEYNTKTPCPEYTVSDHTDQSKNSNRSNRNQTPDQIRSNNRSNGIQMPPYEPLRQNDDEFQSPEPTSEDNAPLVAPRQKPRPVSYDWQQRKENPQEDYDDAEYSEKSDQSAQPRQPARNYPKKDHQVRCRGRCAKNFNNRACRNDPRRRASESISENSLESDQEPVSARQPSRSGSKPTSRVASQVASRNRSNQGSRPASAAQSAYGSKQGLMPPDQEAATRRVYCSRNLNQVDDVHRDNYVECPSKKRLPRRRNEEEPIEDPDLRGRSRTRKENSNARLYRDEDDETPNQRFSQKPSRPRENTRSIGDRYDREDTNFKRRQKQSDPNEEYSPRNNDQYLSYDDDQYPKHSVIKSTMPDKYTARNTMTTYVYAGSDSDNSYNEPSKESEKPRKYEKSLPKYEDDEDSCFCSSEEIEPITRPDYADRVKEYPYANVTREEYPQGYAVEPRDKYPHGFAEETRGKYSITCSKETCNECPHEYDKDTEEEAPVEYVQQISRDARKGRKQEEYAECCTEETCNAYGHVRVDKVDTRDKYPKGQTRDEYPKGRPRSACEKCCDEIQNNYSGDDDQSQVAKETRQDENVDKAATCYCEVAVETEIDMTLNDRKKAINKDGNTNQSKTIKATKKPKLSCKCVPKGKQRSASPSGGLKSRMAPMKRHNKLEDNMENKFQAYDGQLEPRFYRAPEEPRPYNRNLYRQPSGSSRSPYPQSYPTGGMSVLGTFEVPPVLAEKTIDIVKKHISNMTPLVTKDFSKSRQVQAKSVCKESPQRTVTRPRSVSCNEPSRITSNPFRLSPVQVFLQPKRCRSATKSKYRPI
ncbi:hypothetical protein ACLKA6_015640 [Drosophila palustris]